jgi:hypothetical protein
MQRVGYALEGANAVSLVADALSVSSCMVTKRYHEGLSKVRFWRERRACRKRFTEHQILEFPKEAEAGVPLVEIARSTMRRTVVESERNQTLQAKIIDLAQAQRGFGYRQPMILLRR